METKKVLLVAAGGRAMPDVQALFYVQPEIVVAVTSEEGWIGEQAFTDIARNRSNHEFLGFVRNVNAYNFEECLKACGQHAYNLVLSKYSDKNYHLDWVFAIGSAPKITGIATYEVALKKNVPCLVIDTLHEKVISLVKDIETDVKESELFHPDVPGYMSIQKRKYRRHKGKTTSYRALIEGWGNIARELALAPETSSFTSIMHDKKAGTLVPLPSALKDSSIVTRLVKHGLIEKKLNEKGEDCCLFTTAQAAQFLGTGDWLELFVWHEAKEERFADDCRWGYQIIDGNAENELDLALTYKAQLLIGECKTDYNPFKGKRNYLDTLDSNAHLLGGNFVTKLFITNQPKTREGFVSFNEQADKRRIVVLTSKDLSNMGQILRKEAISPTYARI